ncbi:YqjF family protein [Williamsia deligens]|uniref:YqjF family protein n=1 Tax=Williamsia deligens TaxID=321325 RepID=A0ABW3G7X5_9NOCA|nr:DUF2071 domain-containing protein [Williamsia deligens]MCP2193493.1 hypothetical protein [Williamsia deligens]
MSTTTGPPLIAPKLPRPMILDQRWENLTFVHWPVEPASVAHLFPRGTRPDVFADGLTYVALVPFEMHDISLGRTPSVPYLGSFAETNIRLYSVDDAGRHGVVFRSLETTRLAVVPITRIVFGMPYTWAGMSVLRQGTRVRYQSRRRWPDRGLRSRLEVEIGEPVEPTELEQWLTARWGAHTRIAGQTWWVPNEHTSWPLHRAEILHLDDDLLDASGVTAAGPPLRALWSPGVRTQFGRPSLVR